MFVHLRLHTEFSVVDGTNRIDEVVKAAAARRPARAGDHRPEQPVRRHQVLQGSARRGRQAAHRRRGAGAGLARKDRGARRASCCWCRTSQGYLNLCELLARAWTQQRRARRRRVCKLRMAARAGRRPDRAVGRAGRAGGPGAAAGRRARARRGCALQLAALFPHRFYIELQRAGRPDDEAHVRRGGAAGRAAEAAGGGDASGAVHRAEDDYEAHEARVCIAEGEMLANPRRVRTLHARAVLQDAGARWRRCSPTCRAALANTLEIAKRCNLVLELGKPQLPNFPTPERHADRRVLPRRVARGPGGAPAAAVPRCGAAREASGRATWSGWSSRSTPSSRWASPATS